MSYQKLQNEDYPPPGYGTAYPPPSAYPSAPPPPSAYTSAPPPPLNQGYPTYPPPLPVGYPYPPPPQHGGGYQGYFNHGPPPPPPPVYHCDHHHHHDDDGCSSFLRGCERSFRNNCNTRSTIQSSLKKTSLKFFNQFYDFLQNQIRINSFTTF